MEIIIKSRNGKRYTISHDSSRESKPLGLDEVSAILKGANPEAPTSWSALWKIVKPSNHRLLHKDEDIMRELRALVSDSRLYFEELGKHSDSIPYTDDNAATSTKDARGGRPYAETVLGGGMVSMASGEVLLQFVDAILPGPMPYAWKRTYRSSHHEFMGLGCSWIHSGSERIEEGEIEVWYFDEEGRRLPFAVPRHQKHSKYIPEHLILERKSDTVFVLRKEGEWDKIFTRINAMSQHYRLTQLRHSCFVPEKRVGDNVKPEVGYCINFYYNEDGRVRRIRGNWGMTFFLERNPQGRLAQLVLANEKLEQQTCVAEYEYSEEGDLISVESRLCAPESYRYASHMLVSRTLVCGGNYHFEWQGEDPHARCKHVWSDHEEREYYFDWLPESYQSRVIDSLGATTQYKHNRYGQPLEVTDPEGGIHQYHYSYGRKDTYTDPAGNTTEYFYDSENHAVGQRNALGHDSSIGYFQSLPTSFKNFDKSHWQCERDRKGLITRLKDPYELEMTLRYNEQGLPLVKTDPMGRKTFYHWGPQGELIKFIDPSKSVREYRYNPWGQVSEMEFFNTAKESLGSEKYHYDENGLVCAIETLDDREFQFEYNESHQLIKLTERQKRDVSEQNSEQAANQPPEKTTLYRYNQAGLLVERIDAEGQRLRYEYDSEDKLTAFINEVGDRCEFSYDANSRLVKEVGFDGRTQHYKYDAAGHLIKYLDAGEVLAEFEYDALGHMTKQTRSHFVDKEQAQERIRYRYDEVGRVIETYNNQQYVSLEYSFYGGLTKEKHCDINEKQNLVPSTTLEINYRQVWPGLINLIHMPVGQIAYQYSSLNMVVDIAFNETSFVQVERDAAGYDHTRQLAGLVVNREFDASGRIIKQSCEALPTLLRAYHYDAADNISEMTSVIQEESKSLSGSSAATMSEYFGRSSRYIYDLQHRLEEVQHVSKQGSHTNFNETYDFDSASTLVASNGGDVGKSAGGRLQAFNNKRFVHDARGNIVREYRDDKTLLASYRYNLHNQLVRVEKAGQVTEYQYDSLGRRTKKIQAETETRYTWAGDLLVQEQQDDVLKVYVYEPDSHRPVAMLENNCIYYYVVDHIGTPYAMVDTNGEIVWQVVYKSYGEVKSFEVQKLENNLRAIGQYFDSESGLHYNRHRYYNPKTGMYLSQNPMGLVQQSNLYLYATNPLQWINPYACNPELLTFPDQFDLPLDAVVVKALDVIDIRPPENCHEILQRLIPKVDFSRGRPSLMIHNKSLF